MVSKQKRKMLCTIILLVFFGAGCAKEYAKTAYGPSSGRQTQASIILENQIRKFEEASSHIRGMAWFLIGDGEEERQTDAAVVVMRPDHARVDALDPLADVWARAGTDGKMMWLFIPAKSKLYSGRASKGNLFRLTKFDFEMPELISILAGGLPIKQGSNLVEIVGEKPPHFFAEGSNIHLWTDLKGTKVTKVIRFSKDSTNVDYSVAFSDYRRIGGIDFPCRIELRFPERGARMVVVYKDVELGGKMDSVNFSPPSSGREKVHRLDKS